MEKKNSIWSDQDWNPGPFAYDVIQSMFSQFLLT